MAAAVLLVGAGCKKDAPAIPGPKTVEVGKESPKEAEAPVAEDPVVSGDKAHALLADAVAGKPILVLIDAGTEPRTQLRFAPEAGSSETATMAMGMDMEMKVQDQTIPIKMPQFIMKMGVDITSVDKESGDFSYKLDLTDATVGEGAGPGVDATVVETMRDMLQKMKGMSGTATVTARGNVQSANFTVPPNAPAEIRQVIDSFQQSMQQISVPFPEEAVGVGAIWQVTSVVEQSGMKLGMVSVFELKTKDGESVTVSHQIKQSADAQYVEAPGMPAGSRAKLKMLKGEGSGEGTFKFTKVLPQTFTSRLALALDMEVEVGGQTQSISMKTDLDLKMSGE